MNIIPVLDLMNGKVVHAKHGERHRYLPIQSKLTPSCEPIAVIEALLALYPFTHLYIADIDAIQQRGNHTSEINAIAQTFPQLTIWLDAGFSHIEDLSGQNANIRPVLGSESLDSIECYQALISRSQSPPILSLDFKNGGFLGPQSLISGAGQWPQEVIVMSLNKVGSNAGPDMQGLNEIQSRCLSSSIYAAGGVRAIDDLITLQQANIQGALIASALHNGAISSSDLEKLKP